jgi:uncharacterized protein
MNTLAWAGVEEPLFEVAFVDVGGGRLEAHGTQLGAAYRLTYEVETDFSFVTERFAAECETAGGVKRVELRRGVELTDGALDVDLQFSPLFNSLPVLRDRLLNGGEARPYTMAFVLVPELNVVASEQKYAPLEPGLVRFSSGTFSADISFDADGFVVDYPQLARRVRMS